MTSLFQKINENNKLLNLEDIVQNNYTHAGRLKFYKNKNIKVIDNTPQEILETTKEMIQNLENKNLDFKYNKKSYSHIFDLGKGNLSNIF